MHMQCAGGGGRTMQLQVLHLDDSVHTFHLSVHATGQELFASMVDRIQLLESDYFDLLYMNNEGLKFWLDHDKPILRQLSPGKELVFRFAVKFYTPFPNLLEEECTRYLFALQIKHELVNGTLLCSENTAALLASYIVQAEIGDFIDDEYQSIDYLRSLKLLYHPTDERLRRIMEFHKAHIGLSPSDADLALLDTVRKAEFYGLHLHFVRNHEGLGLNVAVNHQGILVYQNHIRINTFFWAQVRKLSFKRRRFLMKLQPERYDASEFIFDSRDECKQFWKNCLEHHAFFRCPVLQRSLIKQPGLTRSGSSFRYTGRTEQELAEFVQEHSDNRMSFERPSSARRAYSTILGGSSYPTRKLNAASMQLRSLSADRRGPSLVHTNTSLVANLGHSTPLKRTQSEGAKDTADDLHKAPTADVDGMSALPTSGYATMAESAGSGRSTEATAAVEHDTEEKSTVEPEIDTLMWINETCRRMTGDWTGDTTQVTESHTLSETQRSKSAAGSPRTSATVSLGQLNADLEGFLKRTDQTGTYNDTSDDRPMTHLFLLSDLCQTANIAQPHSMPAEPTEVVDFTLQPQPNRSPQHVLSDLARSVFLSDPNMARLVGWMTSPTHGQNNAVGQCATLPGLSNTQPDLLRQAENSSRTFRTLGIEHNTRSAVDVVTKQQKYYHQQQQQQQSSELSSRPGELYRSSDITDQPEVTQSSVAPTTFVSTTATVQTLSTSTGFMDEYGLQTPKTLFILPTVTQYGLDINMDGPDNRAHETQKHATMTHSTVGLAPHAVAMTAEQELGSSGYPLVSETPSIQGTVLPTHSMPAHSVPFADSKMYSLASVQPQQLTYGVSQMEHSTGEYLYKNEYDSPFSPRRSDKSFFHGDKSSPLTTSITITTIAPAITTYKPSECRILNHSDSNQRSVPVDQWSSSGSESTTGVIIRPDVVHTGLRRSDLTLSKHRRVGCLHLHDAVSVSRTDSLKSSVIRSTHPLPTLPVDTLPARPSHRTSLPSHTSGHSQSLSRSTPYGVHLSGLEAVNLLGDAYSGHPAKALTRNGDRHCMPKPEKHKKAEDAAIRPESMRPNPTHRSPQDGAAANEIRAAAEMLEEVPYVVLRRPTPVDVKKYHLHLQRQQQQAAALVAAGYPFHAPNPFYGDPNAYHFSSRMPMAPQLTHAPMVPMMLHHMPSKPSKSVSHDAVRYGKTSTSVSRHLTNQNGDALGQLHHDRSRSHRRQRYCSQGESVQQSMPDTERDKRKVKKRHLKSQTEMSLAHQEPCRDEQPLTTVVHKYDPVSSHHLHCVHRQKSIPKSLPDEVMMGRSIVQAKRVLHTKPRSTDPVSSVPPPQAMMSSRSVEMAQSVQQAPFVERIVVRHKRHQPDEPEDNRESEVPYPVSEILSPRSKQTRSTRMEHAVQERQTTRHQHHPACASLIGRTRQKRYQDSKRDANATRGSEVVAPPTSVCRVHQAKMGTGRLPRTESGEKPVLRRDRVPRKSEENDESQKETRETIEKLRQDLRTAGFQVASTGPRSEPASAAASAADVVTAERQRQPVTVRKTIKTSTAATETKHTIHSMAKDSENQAPSVEWKRELKEHAEKARMSSTSSASVAQQQESLMKATSLAVELDLPFGGAAGDPIYLESDTDSDERDERRKQPTTEPMEQTQSQVITCDVAKSSDTTADSHTLVNSEDQATTHPPLSPTSHSPSLPLSFLPSDEQLDETDVSLGSQSSLVSTDSARCSPLPCPECQWYRELAGVFPPPSHFCYPHHPKCHHTPWHDYNGHRYCQYAHTYCPHHSCAQSHHRSHAPSHRHHHHHQRAHSLRHRSEHSKAQALSHRGKHRRTVSDKRTREHSTSSFDTWTSSLSSTSASEEFSDGFAQPPVREAVRASGEKEINFQVVLNRLLAQERRLRAELAKNRALTKELKQAKQQAQRLLGPEHVARTRDENESPGEYAKLGTSQEILQEKRSVTDGSEYTDRTDGSGQRKLQDRSHHRRVHAVSAAKRTLMSRSTRLIKTKLPTSSTEEKPDAVLGDHWVIENKTAAVADAVGLGTGAEPGLVSAEAGRSQGTTAEMTQENPLKLAFATYELEVIAEVALFDTNGETTAGLATEHVPQGSAHATTSTTILSAKGSTDPSRECEILARAPTPPTEPPPFCFTSTPNTSPSREPSHLTEAPQPFTTPTQSELAEEVGKSSDQNKLSTINEMSNLTTTSDPQSDADSEYDGTRALDLLSEVIENALASDYSRADFTNHSTPDRTRCRSLTGDDSHTSETSVETIKPAYSPTRAGSPSNSTTSASEGSEDIEPFPPPPPETNAEYYVGHSGTLTHSGHVFQTGLDEVIEEEIVIAEPEVGSNQELHDTTGKHLCFELDESQTTESTIAEQGQENEHEEVQAVAQTTSEESHHNTQTTEHYEQTEHQQQCEQLATEYSESVAYEIMDQIVGENFVEEVHVAEPKQATVDGNGYSEHEDTTTKAEPADDINQHSIDLRDLVITKQEQVCEVILNDAVTEEDDEESCDQSASQPDEATHPETENISECRITGEDQMSPEHDRTQHPEEETIIQESHSAESDQPVPDENTYTEPRDAMTEVAADESRMDESTQNERSPSDEETQHPNLTSNQ